VGRTVVYFPETPEYSHLTDADNIKHSDLTGADNGNKPTLPSSQGDQTEFCFVRIAYVVRPLIWHKDAALDLLGCHYPFLFTLVLLVNNGKEGWPGSP
jgi:hypothetical protein